MEAARYFLPRYVYLSTTSRYVVVLDVRRDRYTCIPRRCFDPLKPWLSGWFNDEPSAEPSSNHRLDPVRQKQLAALVAQGILTQHQPEAKPVRPTCIAAPRFEVTIGAGIRARSTLFDVVPFLLACRRADLTLKRRRLEDVIQVVSLRARSIGCTVHPRVADRAIHLARVFAALRLLYPRPVLCTFDSLALLEFMAARDICGQWVFGVRADPFQAHCWVQLGETVLNDRLERIATLAPIMSV